ncbi:MAG: tetratricopeptide repeat protein, partial [Acidobacteria bacterium]|nr:tetratricopeptide repeat protein [Acidobacteriota bacterium]
VMLTRSPASALTERDTLLLADVRNATGDRVFDDTLRLALAVNLEQAPFLRILPQDVVRGAVARAGRSPDERVVGPLALDVCRREGAAVMLAASIAPLGSRYAVGIEAVACGTGEEIGRAFEQAESKERVLTALERAATRIREKLGESRASLSLHNVPLVRATTPSLEALQALTLGDHFRDHAKPAEAFTFYRQATELDPAFALAWARRGAAAINVGALDDAIPAFRRAYLLRDRVSPPERFYIVAHYYRVVEADPEKAIEAYLAWKQMYPGSAIPPTNLASTYSSWMGQYDAALVEAREAVRLAPGSSLASTNLVVACLGSGRLDEAAAALTAAEGRGQDDRLTRGYRLTLALATDNRAALDLEMRRASGDPMATLLTVRLRALAATAGGRLREARQIWADALARAGETGSAALVAAVRLDQAEAEALLGEPREARVAVEAGLAADRGIATLLSAAIVFDLAGKSDRARAILDGVARQGVADAVLRRVWLPVAMALNAASQGQINDARRILNPVVRFERGNAFNLIPLGVRAIIERLAHRPGNAAAAFGDLVRLRALQPVSPWVPFARLSRARALRESGDPAESLAAYDAFLESWKGADSDAPILVAARRERAAIAPR